MSKESAQPTQLVLTRDSALNRIRVDMEAFFDFSFWMAEELEDLVANWQHENEPRAEWQNRQASIEHRT